MALDMQRGHVCNELLSMARLPWYAFYCSSLKKGDTTVQHCALYRSFHGKVAQMSIGHAISSNKHGKFQSETSDIGTIPPQLAHYTLMQGLFLWEVLKQALQKDFETVYSGNIGEPWEARWTGNDDWRRMIFQQGR